MSGWWAGQPRGRPWEQVPRWGRQVWARGPGVRREWTGPKLGAVRVMNSAGWPAKAAGVSGGSTSPARTMRRAS